MAHLQKADLDENEDINSCREVLDLEKLTSNTLTKKDVNTDTFYIELLNNSDSNDSNIDSALKTDESIEKNCTNDELVEEINVIEGNSMVEKHKSEVLMQSLGHIVSFDSTSAKLNDSAVSKTDESVEKNSANNELVEKTSCIEGNIFENCNPEAPMQSLGNKETCDVKLNDVPDLTTNESSEKNCSNNEIVEEASCIEINSLVQKDKLESLQDVLLDSTSENASVEIKMSNKEISSKSSKESKVMEIRNHEDSDSWSNDSSSSSSSDSDFLEEMHHSIIPKTTTIKSKGELDLEDLPPIEDLQISVEEKELVTIGAVHSIVGKQVVVHAQKDQKPLDLDSVLFLSHDKPLGRIFDVFGPVSEPMYVVRFNSPEDIKKQGITVNDVVYFAPFVSDITSFVFVDVLKQQKGSDASWKDNNEPPVEHLDYSDDEQERIAKQKRRGKNRTRPETAQGISSKKSNNDIKPVIGAYRQSNQNMSMNYEGKKYQPLGHSFQSHSSENVFRRTYNYSKDTGRKIPVFKNSPSTRTRSSCAHPPRSEEVPVWITSPPQIFQTTCSTTRLSLPNTVSSASIHYQQQNIFQHSSQQTKNAQPVPSFSSLRPIRPAELVLNPKQPFIPYNPPYQQQNISHPSVIQQTQNQPPVQSHYINPLQPPIHQQVQRNIVPQVPVFQNINQTHVNRPVISVPSVTPMSIPTQTFNSSSTSITSTPFMPTNFQTFGASPFPVSGGNEPYFWPQNLEQGRSSYSVVPSPPSTVQFNSQVPSFPSRPSLIRFNSTPNCLIPPQPPSSPLSQQFLPNHSRF